MTLRLYTELLSIGNITIYQVSVDPNGVLVASRGSIAVRSDAGNAATWQNTNGASAWSLLGGGDNLFTDGSTFAAATTANGGSVLIGGSRTGSPTTIPSGTIRTTAGSDGVGLLAAANLTATTGTAIVEAKGAASVFGAAAAYGGGNATLYSYNGGSFISGNAIANGGNAYMRAQGSSMVTGGVFGYGGYEAIIRASDASMAFGHVYASGADGSIYSTGVGSLAGGYVVDGGAINASGTGSTATGSMVGVPGVSIQSSGAGSNAWGAITSASAFGILASGMGSTAFGNPQGAAIIASAAGSVQFGSGTNSLAHSFRFGTGLRILTQGTGSANYDLWTAGGNVYVRSGGATRNLSNIP